MRNTRAPKNHPRRSSITSLTGLVYCWQCKGRMHVGYTSSGKRHFTCYNRSQGKDCSQKSVMLDVLEEQIEAYLGLVKYKVQSLMTVIAMNLKRMVLLLCGVSFRGPVRTSAKA